MKTWRWVLGMMLVAGAANAAAADAAFARETEAWRTERVAKLLEPDNWLTLVGLHFLKAGDSTVGSAKGNDVVIASGPARLGTVTVTKDGVVTLRVVEGVDVLVAGQRVRMAELKPAAGGKKATMVTSGTLTLFVVDPNGRRALRVKDSASERRTKFAGLDHFAPDPAWRIEARWEEFEKSRVVMFTDVLGQPSPMVIPGKAVFERDGKRFEFLAIDEGRNRPLFFVFSDTTNGKETYGGGRHLYTAWPKDGKVILDFNRAENPPCAFTPFSMCPLPPKENRLPLPVRAGEKDYRGKRD